MTTPSASQETSPEALKPQASPPDKPLPAQNARQLLKDLQERFPVFRDCQPLAIGIDKQLMARLPGLERKSLRIALGIHTHSLRYLKASEKAPGRVDLDGQPAGEITPEQRLHASELVKERLRKQAEQRKMQRQAEAQERQHAAKLGQLVEKFGRST
ncbi:MAG: ProP effector [Candidatus Accumulibacter regalis]|jgi:ProP effector|uniref:ProQ/FINO family protein n=1 Tax=unclassified Candidatus Accumulibacter TaxID=2619054 RepID=UPI001AC91F2D|nr:MULTISPECIES: ProQ/FINO family protein [unclassified Candidatus Accumulibacter]MBN8514699.1 osmoprotectant transporter activator [Accumulibacter sp.]MBO3702301.1 osmoprotectant transporter activator [Accumulibacter sp.]